ncbi:flagellar basal body rod protein FlgC [Candidatus Nucleicultrix amoebiphila]|jgi:flagellar basal-body rod protein FlgC|uniref:hypothetical protein n=1 Tax=Candidatus Nucleicultrix amoebiphila TaxID=1509244 RepID=UPI000A26F763|nr:hypothetical protein [Candidatus Nucleicultrix amoebiphila]
MVDNISPVKKMAIKALKANNERMKVISQNMANSQSANYVPKEITFKSKLDKQSNVQVVEVQKVTSNSQKMHLVYNPSHPNADGNGYVKMPDINPLMEMMNLQETKQDATRAMKITEVDKDLEYKTIRLISGR